MKRIKEQVSAVLRQAGLWREALVRGAFNYGLNETRYPGDNIFLLFKGNQAVLISFPYNKAVVDDFIPINQEQEIVQIRKRKADEIRELLREKNLLYIRKKEGYIPPSEHATTYTWICKACGKEGHIEGGLESEEGSGGQGAEATFKKICEDHKEKSPECNILNLKILDKNLVEQIELTKLFSELLRQKKIAV